MSRRRLVKLSEVWAMLEACAKGYTQRLTDHYYRVSFDKKLYPSLPRGDHGRGDKEIELGHVIKMARFLGILECAQAFFGLDKKQEPATGDEGIDLKK